MFIIILTIPATLFWTPFETLFGTLLQTTLPDILLVIIFMLTPPPLALHVLLMLEMCQLIIYSYADTVSI